jgi:hypothetical protein
VPILPQLLSDDGPDASAAHPHPWPDSSSWSTSSR